MTELGFDPGLLDGKQECYLCAMQPPWKNKINQARKYLWLKNFLKPKMMLSYFLVA